MAWTYANSTGVKTPFVVPSDIIDVDRLDLEPTAALSKFVKLTQGATGGAKVSITNDAGTNYYDLNGLILSEYYNYIESVVHTKGQGVLGLLE